MQLVLYEIDNKRQIIIRRARQQRLIGFTLTTRIIPSSTRFSLVYAIATCLFTPISIRQSVSQRFGLGSIDWYRMCDIRSPFIIMRSFLMVLNSSMCLLIVPDYDIRLFSHYHTPSIFCGMGRNSQGAIGHRCIGVLGMLMVKFPYVQMARSVVHWFAGMAMFNGLKCDCS